MMEHENAIKIAVIEEKISGLRAQSVAHNSSTQTRFDHMEQKIDELTAIMNRGKGAYAASLLIAGAIGALALAAISALSSLFHR